MPLSLLSVVGAVAAPIFIGKTYLSMFPITWIALHAVFPLCLIFFGRSFLQGEEEKSSLATLSIVSAIAFLARKGTFPNYVIFAGAALACFLVVKFCNTFYSKASNAEKSKPSTAIIATFLTVSFPVYFDSVYNEEYWQVVPKALSLLELFRNELSGIVGLFAIAYFISHNRVQKKASKTASAIIIFFLGVITLHCAFAAYSPVQFFEMILKEGTWTEILGDESFINTLRQQYLALTVLFTALVVITIKAGKNTLNLISLVLLVSFFQSSNLIFNPMIRKLGVDGYGRAFNLGIAMPVFSAIVVGAIVINNKSK